MEKRDLVDKNRKLVGEISTTGSKIQEEKYIQIVLICIENHKHEFLIQKRAKKKDGKWALTGGHIISGEESVKAVLRETEEELGLELEENEVELVFSKKAYDCFVDVYYTKQEVELTTLKLEPKEVENVAWINLEAILELKEKETFLDCHYECLQECLYFLKKIREGEEKCIN